MGKSKGLRRLHQNNWNNEHTVLLSTLPFANFNTVNFVSVKSDGTNSEIPTSEMQYSCKV